MALFLLKPIFWNSNSYIQPAGAIATSGFPRERGYGHEEWNNSPRLRWTHNEQHYRVFHTESVGTAPLAENAGQTFVFMMSSHDRLQQLVGVAANAIGMMDDRYMKERRKICRQLCLDRLWSDAWNVPIVQAKHGHSVTEFKPRWKEDLHWVPNWLCRDDHYLWLSEPVTLDPIALVGKKRFLGMYSSYTSLDLTTALRIMYAIPTEQQDTRWKRIIDAMQSAPNGTVPAKEADPVEAPVTDILTRINARRGQGQFRDNVMTIWDNACAVTGLNFPTALKASHVKPWSKANGHERLDSHNGLILSANLDALFDRGFISFTDDGAMLVSSRLSDSHRTYFGIPANLRQVPSTSLQRYLAHHRGEVFIP